MGTEPPPIPRLEQNRQDADQLALQPATAKAS